MNLLCSSSVSLLASSQTPTNSMTQHYCRTLRMIMWVCYFPSMLTGYCDITFKHTYIFLKGKERESWKVLGIKIVSKGFNMISMSYALTLEKAMAPHSSTLAWKIPWTEEPGRLQSMGLLRAGQDWVTSLSLFTFMHWRRKWQPTPVFLPGESQGWRSWWAAVYRVAQSQTWLKQLSSSSMPWLECEWIQTLYRNIILCSNL